MSHGDLTRQNGPPPEAHQPTDRIVGGVRAVNIGSIGNPMTTRGQTVSSILDGSGASGNGR
jgi:hypothetical protein